MRTTTPKPFPPEQAISQALNPPNRAGAFFIACCSCLVAATVDVLGLEQKITCALYSLLSTCNPNLADTFSIKLGIQDTANPYAYFLLLATGNCTGLRQNKQCFSCLFSLASYATFVKTRQCTELAGRLESVRAIYEWTLGADEE